MLMKLRYIIIILILIIIIFPLAFIFTSIVNNNENSYNFTILCDKENIRTYEIFNLSIHPKISDINISWNPGNGEIIYNDICEYYYRYSDEFIVTVNITYPEGRQILEYSILIYNRDLKATAENEGFRTLIPFVKITRGTGSRVESGISNPEVNIEIIYKGTGSMGPFVELTDEITDDTTIITDYTEYVFNIEKKYTITLSSEITNFRENSYLINGGVQLENGVVEYWTIHIDIKY